MTWVSWPTEEQEPYNPAWVGEVMTPGLAAPCTKVKPRLDPMTELMGFGVVED